MRITDIQNDRVDWERVPGCAIEQIEMQKYLLQDNDILIARTGGTVGKSYLIQEPKLAAVFASYLIRIAPPPGVEAHYLKLFLGSPLYWGQLNAQSKGTGQPNVNGVSLGNLLVPLPPLAEQRRIVAKVESLFAQTRALEAKLRQARADLVTVNRAALHRLSVAADADAFVAAWTTVRDAFDLLYADPRNVAELRRAILQLAVQGKLVPQDPADEPASELLKRIREQTRRLVKAGKAVDTRPLPPILAKQVSHEIAKNWKWVRLAEIAEVIMGQSPPGDSYNSDGEGVPLINGPVEFSSGPFGETQKTKFTTTPTKMCQSGDLLICVRGSTTGRTNVAAFDACIGRGVAAIRAYVSQEYLNNFVLSQRQIIYDLGTGSTFPSVSQDRIRELLVPLPPLAEQRRIVARVDQLMRLCDALEAGLARAEGARRALTAAVLGGAA